MKAAKTSRVLAQNRKARHDFFIEETMEAGIELKGTEVKSIRLGKVNMRDSYVNVKNGEAYLHNMHVSAYEKGNIFNQDPLRARRLLLHKREIRILASDTTRKGMTIVPLEIYLSHGLVKIKIALAQGKKNYDRRADIAERDAKRAIEREFATRVREG